MKKVAVVILNYNGAEMLMRFLPLVVDYSPEAEVVVADNASTDNSVEVMKEQFPAVRLLQLDSNYGFAGGYNKALAQVEAEYYVLLNSDVEVTPGWLSPLLEFMEFNDTAVACQPKILDYKRKTHFEYAGAAGGFIDYYGYPYCRGRVFNTVEADSGQYNDVHPLFWATGAAMFVRSKAYWSAGGLDEGFFAHMEEIDLCWRFLARGSRIYAVPQSTVYHVGGATLDKGNPQKTFLNFRNNLLLLYKNLPESELRRTMRVRTLLDYIAAVKFLVAGDFGHFKAVLRARSEFKRLKPQYKAVREANMAACVVDNIPERKNFSLLWQYYARGKRTFTSIKEK